MKKIDSKKYFDMLNIVEKDFYSTVAYIEGIMEKETGIKDIMFVWSDNEIVGIGNADYTKMKLIHRR